MNKRLLFCVETNHQADTDYQYIRETILHYYVDNKRISYRSLYLKTKTRYNNPSIVKKINKFCNYSDKENTHIIYFIDTDNCDVSPETKKLLDEIEEYCNRNNYDLVLFCKDIEDVYWGYQIPNNEKTKMADKFKKGKKIETVSEVELRKTGRMPHSSNILTILDKHFEKKDLLKTQERSNPSNTNLTHF